MKQYETYTVIDWVDPYVSASLARLEIFFLGTDIADTAALVKASIVCMLYYGEIMMGEIVHAPHGKVIAISLRRNEDVEILHCRTINRTMDVNVRTKMYLVCGLDRTGAYE